MNAAPDVPGRIVQGRAGTARLAQRPHRPVHDHRGRGPGGPAPLGRYHRRGGGGDGAALGREECRGRCSEAVPTCSSPTRVSRGRSSCWTRGSTSSRVRSPCPDAARSEWSPGAGLPAARLAAHVAEAGLSGLEFACAIPGSVGGSVAMNAGAHGSCMADVVDFVQLAGPGGSAWVRADELSWTYRECRIPDDAVVTAASFLPGALRPSGDPRRAPHAPADAAPHTAAGHALLRQRVQEPAGRLGGSAARRGRPEGGAAGGSPGLACARELRDEPWRCHRRRRPGPDGHDAGHPCGAAAASVSNRRCGYLGYAADSSPRSSGHAARAHAGAAGRGLGGQGAQAARAPGPRARGRCRGGGGRLGAVVRRVPDRVPRPVSRVVT